MNECDRQTGERYLAGLLSQAEERSFVGHLDTCAACRQDLVTIAGDEMDWRTARELLQYSCAEHHRPDFGSSILYRPSPEADEGDPVRLASLSFLGATDDPAMIGRIGSYEIRGILGRGGFGWVLKGHDRALDRVVAIKILDPAAASVGPARERFAREARAMASVSHEHVVPVYAVDTHAGLPYFVMEYVAGGSLERRLKTEGHRDVVSIVRIGLQIAQALAAAHRDGLVHRDIKPGNILLDHGTERVRVADFGLARVANEVSSTRSGVIAGTPQYMAPEQVRGEACDGQSDLFSLGAVIYELCTGHAPFRADSVYGVMQRIVHDEPRSIREQNPDIPDWLERFVLRLLEKDKPRRFASSEEVSRLLQQELAHLQNPAVTDRPDRAWSRASTASGRRRSRVAAGGLALAVVAVIVGLAFFRPGSGEEGADRGTTGNSAGGVTAPLWGADGAREALDLANLMEARWRRPTESAAPE
ncbi:MAG TPA: protein kinase, partial [Pirellulales bacterium]|nr:protein kinase [Pirellulales bacterium]